MTKWTELKTSRNNELKQFKFKEIDDCIKGIVEKPITENKRYPGNYFIILSNDSGKYIINCSSNLKYQLLDLCNSGVIAAGDKILIRFYKEKYNKGLNNTKLYKIFKEE